MDTGQPKEKSKPGPKPRAGTPPRHKPVPPTVQTENADYKTPQPINRLSKAYWDHYIPDNQLHPSLAGLARFFGYTSERALLDFVDGCAVPCVQAALKKEILRLEEYTTSLALDNQIGAIHVRKTDFGKSEKDTLIIEEPHQLTPEERKEGEDLAKITADARRKQILDRVKIRRVK